jgi:hypothetical protein
VASLKNAASKEEMLAIARRYETLALQAEDQTAELRVAGPTKGKG